MVRMNVQTQDPYTSEKNLMKMEPSDSREKITWTLTLDSSFTVFQDQVMSYTTQGVTLIEMWVTQEHNTV